MLWKSHQSYPKNIPPKLYVKLAQKLLLEDTYTFQNNVVFYLNNIRNNRKEKINSFDSWMFLKIAIELRIAVTNFHETVYKENMRLKKEISNDQQWKYTSHQN